MSECSAWQPVAAPLRTGSAQSIAIGLRIERIQCRRSSTWVEAGGKGVALIRALACPAARYLLALPAFELLCALLLPELEPPFDDPPDVPPLELDPPELPDPDPELPDPEPEPPDPEPEPDPLCVPLVDEEPLFFDGVLVAVGLDDADGDAEAEADALADGDADADGEADSEAPDDDPPPCDGEEYVRLPVPHVPSCPPITPLSVASGNFSSATPLSAWVRYDLTSVTG